MDSVVEDGVSVSAYHLMDFVADAVNVLDARGGIETKLSTFCGGQLEYLVAGRSNHHQLSNFVRFAFALCARATGETLNSTTTEVDELNVFEKLDELWLHLRREMGLEYRFPVSRLRRGRGEEVCRVLYDLSRMAIERSEFDVPKFQSSLVESTTAETEESNPVDNEDENEDDALNHIREEGSFFVPASQQEEDEVEQDLSHRHLQLPHTLPGVNTSANSQPKAHSSMIAARVDPNVWSREVANVSAALRDRKAQMSPLQSKSQWRVHQGQMSKHSTVLFNFTSTAHRRLGELGEYSESALSQVAKKERFLNSTETFRGLAQQYATLREKVRDLQRGVDSFVGALSERQNEFSVISDKLSEAKNQVDLRSGKMADSKPLLKIKGSIKQMASEIQQMDVSIEVVRSELVKWRISRALERMRGSEDFDEEEVEEEEEEEEDGDNDDEDDEFEDEHLFYE